MGIKRISRRHFVSAVTAGAGTLLLKNVASAITPGRIAGKKDPFEKITIGKTGIKSTFLGMGTGYSGYNRSSNITRAGVAESVIRAAYEKGIRFFDCADSYGTHPYTKAALKSIPRENYVLSSKMWVTSGGIPEPERPDSEIVVDRFRKELNTDYLDIVQLHCMTSGDWTDQQKRFMDGLEKCKSKGMIKAHGVSVHTIQALEAAAADPWVDVIHVRINPFGSSMDSKDPAQVAAVVEKMHKAGKGVIGMKLIGNGSYKNDSEKINQALKYVIELGTVDMIIVGFEKPEQIDDYIGRIRAI